MTENQTAEVGQGDSAQGEVAEGEKEQAFQYTIKVEDVGPGSKRVSVEIPRERIEEKLKEQFKDLRKQAAIPGFRSGHAPQKLIEKRFAADVKDQVRRTLIGESYEQAVEKNSLQVIGEPEFEKADEIQLPDEGPLNYSFNVEVQPEITLPDLTNLKVKCPKIQIKEENVDQAMQNLREQQGALVPVEDRGVEAGDYVIADVHVKLDGNVIAHQHDAQMVARPGRLGGFQVDDLDKQLAGLKSGEKKSFNVKAPDDHANEQIRGKELEIEVAAKDIKRLELAEVTPTFLDELGFTDEQQLRDALREQMVEKIGYDVQQAMREQVNRYLLDNVQMQLPEKLSERQTARVVNRRAVDLMMRGIPREQVEANVGRLASGAKDEGARELKLFFILQKIANDQNVDIGEAELNGRIAMLAVQRGQRPEKLKQQMSKDGSLSNLYIQMREHKAIDQILAGAQIEEVEVKPEDAEKGTGPGGTPAVEGSSVELTPTPGEAPKAE